MLSSSPHSPQAEKGGSPVLRGKSENGICAIFPFGQNLVDSSSSSDKYLCENFLRFTSLTVPDTIFKFHDESLRIWNNSVRGLECRSGRKVIPLNFKQIRIKPRRVQLSMIFESTVIRLTSSPIFRRAPSIAGDLGLIPKHLCNITKADTHLFISSRSIEFLFLIPLLPMIAISIQPCLK